MVSLVPVEYVKTPYLPVVEELKEDDDNYENEEVWNITDWSRDSQRLPSAVNQIKSLRDSRSLPVSIAVVEGQQPIEEGIRAIVGVSRLELM